jgi:hypothetical protein
MFFVLLQTTQIGAEGGKKMYRFFIRMKLLEIVSSSAYLFHQERLSRRLGRLNEKMIRLNYAEYFSSNESLFFSQSESLLSLWILPSSVRLLLPEGYLFSKILEDGFYLFHKEEGEWILLIENGKVSKEIFSSHFSQQSLKMLSYANSATLISYDTKMYHTFYEKALSSLGIEDFLWLLKLKISHFKSKSLWLERFSQLFLILSIGIALYVFGMEYRIEMQYTQSRELYKKEIESRKILNSMIEKNESFQSLYQKIDSLLKRKDALSYYALIVSPLKKGSQLKSIKIDATHFMISIEGENAIGVLEALSGIPSFSKVKVVHTQGKIFQIEGDIHEP